MTDGSKRKVGRPRIADELLKAPRTEYKLKSRYTGTQLDIPAPSEAELAKWAVVVERCRVLVLTNASTHDGAKKNMLELVIKGKQPSGWPKGRIVKKELDGSKIMRYNAESVLMWLWERKLAPWNAGMLYRMRREVMQGWAATMGGGASEMLFERSLESLI